MAPPTQAAINLFIWTIVFTVLDVVFVLLRFLAARLIHRRLYADDYLIVFSLMNSFALGAVIIWAIFSSGMGHYETELTPTELVNALKVIPAAYVTWTLGTAAFKLSVLYLYVRIFSMKTFRYLSYGLMGLTVAYCISFLVVFLTTCSPGISQLWHPTPNGHCRDLNVGQLGSVSTNLAIDCLILALPMPWLWKLQMALRNKIVVTIVFSFSFITIGIMIWRIYDLVTTANEDFVYHMPTLALTTTLELWLCIIIACIPTLAPIFKTYVTPVVTKIMASKSSSGIRSGPLSSVTFGRVGGPRRKNYTNMRNRDTTSDSLATGRPDLIDDTFREDTFTTTQVTSNPLAKDVELGPLPMKNAIHVQHDIDTESL
ncbi:hypothetical protein B7494_g4738 [Chlorociboria aeruginascens]|nr:hypothetical protein B7494_g4738 [Chlorociboria aeruginascens]